eukprot:SAG31_NODE_1147_length_9665_cov_10.571399_4_plen_64_part_00
MDVQPQPGLAAGPAQPDAASKAPAVHDPRLTGALAGVVGASSRDSNLGHQPPYDLLILAVFLF